MSITPRMEAVLVILTECAEDGKPCPKNEELAGYFGISSKSSVSLWICQLEAHGLIAVERECWDRVVTIVATGKSTAKIIRAPFEPKQDRHFEINARGAAMDRATMIVSRDPCRRCGVRGDIGCEHQTPMPPMALSDRGRVYA